MATSTYSDVKAKLVTLLQAADDLDGVQVSYGHPGKNLRRQVVMVGDVTGRQNATTLGNNVRYEEYDVEVVANVQDRRGQQEATEAVLVLVAAVEDVLRGNVTLDGLVLWCGPGQLGVREMMAGDGGRESEARLAVHVRGRI